MPKFKVTFTATVEAVDSLHAAEDYAGALEGGALEEVCTVMNMETEAVTHHDLDCELHDRDFGDHDDDNDEVY